MATERVIVGASIMPIYFRQPSDFAAKASSIHEVSNGRFRFGVGVSHALVLNQLGITAGKPLEDMRQFVNDLKEAPRGGELPPLVLATLRDKMIQLSEEIAGGMVFANGARSHMGHSLSVLSDEARASDGFFVGNMIPTCISDDREAAAATNRRTLTPSASEVREGIEASLDAGIKTPVIVPSSASGNQVKAFEEFFAIWD